jgi:hypothetical protein
LPGFSALVVPVEALCRKFRAERADFQQIFRGENPVTVGAFTMRYDPERDRIHFNGITKTSAPLPAQVAAVLPPFDAMQPIQKVHSSMTPEQLRVIAKTEWATDPNLRREFRSESGYVAFRVADVQGRVRIFGRARTGGN